MIGADLGWLAGVCIAAGGILVKLTERLVPSQKDQDDEARSFRKELRDEVKELRDRTRAVEREVTVWRSGCISLMDYCLTLRANLVHSRERIDELSRMAGLPLETHPPIPPLPIAIIDGEIHHERRGEERSDNALAGGG